MLKSKLLYDFRLLAFVFFVLTLPFGINLNTFCIVLWGLFSLFIFITTPKYQVRYKIFLYWPFYLLFLSLTLGVVIFDGYTNFFKNTELYYSLFLIPVIFIFNERLFVNKTFKALVLALLLAIILSFVLAIIRNYYYNIEYNLSLNSINPWFYTYKYLSTPSSLSPTYFSLYLMSCIIYLNGWKKKIKKENLLTSLIFAVFIVLLSSRVIMIYMLGYIFMFLIFGLKAHFYKKIIFLGTVFLFVAIIVISVNPVKKRIETALYSEKKESFSGLDFRIAIWKSVYHEIIIDNWLFGIGTKGDQEMVNNAYRKHDLRDAARLNYNSHNQYVDLLLKNGVVGLLAFLCLCFWLLYLSFKQNYNSLFIIVTLLMTVSITESILYRQKGMVFFVLIGGLIISNYIYENSNIRNKRNSK